MFFNRIEIGKRIENERKNQNLSQEALAEMVDVTAKTIYNLEQGMTCPKSSVLIEVIHALKMDYTYAITGKFSYVHTHDVLVEIAKLINEVAPEVMDKIKS